MKRLIPASALLGCCALAACSSSAVHGTVTSKQYLPAYTDWEMVPTYGQRCTMVIVLVGKTDEDEDECSQYVLGEKLMPVYHDACYQLAVAGKQGGTECVSETQYDDVKVGGSV